jgi:hypothetical protein
LIRVWMKMDVLPDSHQGGIVESLLIGILDTVWQRSISIWSYQGDDTLTHRPRPRGA